jgi:hypothetical protein
MAAMTSGLSGALTSAINRVQVVSRAIEGIVGDAVTSVSLAVGSLIGASSFAAAGSLPPKTGSSAHL